MDSSSKKWCSPGHFQIELDVCILDFPKVLGNNDNLGHNILEHYNVLIQTWLTTNKAKRDIYIANLVNELPHELQDDLRLRILGKKEILGKSQNLGGDKA